jgi:hypothetical protein
MVQEWSNRHKLSWKGFNGTNVARASETCAECEDDTAVCGCCKRQVCGPCLSFCPLESCSFEACAEHMKFRLWFNPVSHLGDPYHCFTGLSVAPEAHQRAYQALSSEQRERLRVRPICFQCKRTAPKRVLVHMLLLAATGRAEHVAPFALPPPEPRRVSRSHAQAVEMHDARPRERLRVLVWLAAQSDGALAGRILQLLDGGLGLVGKL